MVKNSKLRAVGWSELIGFVGRFGVVAVATQLRVVRVSLLQIFSSLPPLSLTALRGLDKTHPKLSLYCRDTAETLCVDLYGLCDYLETTFARFYLTPVLQ